MKVNGLRKLRRHALGGSSVGHGIGIPGGAKFYTRQLKKNALLSAGQKWPGHRRFFLGGSVLRPASYRSALRG